MGLALCVSISLQEDGTTIVDNPDSQVLPNCNLICHLETDIGSLEPLHKHCLTNDHLKLLRLGGFIWVSYIPRVSFLKYCLNQQSSFIEASVAIDCQGVQVQRCGFRLLYQNDEVEFKETIRRLSQTWDNVVHQENPVKPNQEDKAAEPSTSSNSDDPKPKDKGKMIVE
jgi:hypothetical protein